jgi:hypothetical protein
MEMSEDTLKNFLMAAHMDIANLTDIIRHKVDLDSAEKMVLEEISDRNKIVVQSLTVKDEE